MAIVSFKRDRPNGCDWVPFFLVFRRPDLDADFSREEGL